MLHENYSGERYNACGSMRAFCDAMLNRLNDGTKKCLAQKKKFQGLFRAMPLWIFHYNQETYKNQRATAPIQSHNHICALKSVGFLLQFLDREDWLDAQLILKLVVEKLIIKK